jgi:hypothetical protein
LSAQDELFTQPARETAVAVSERKRSSEQLSEKIISCGAEFWLASDAFCGLAYAALFQISSFPQGLPMTYMSCNRHPVWVNRVL